MNVLVLVAIVLLSGIVPPGILLVLERLAAHRMYNKVIAIQNDVKVMQNSALAMQRDVKAMQRDVKAMQNDVQQAAQSIGSTALSIQQKVVEEILQFKKEMKEMDFLSENEKAVLIREIQDSLVRTFNAKLNHEKRFMQDQIDSIEPEQIREMIDDRGGVPDMGSLLLGKILDKVL